MTDFGQLKSLDLRTIWPHEASDFTPWLATNLAALGNALGMELELEEREASVGDFSVDVLARDLGTGHRVIIENQLAQTDHDHPGKLLTYAAGFDASVVVWICERVRDEHRQALEWLNQRTDSDTQFFGVVVELIQIDDSRPAYNFKPVVFPNEWQKAKRSRRATTQSGKGEAYRVFFQGLIDELRDKHRFTGARLGQPQNFYAFASGISGLHYGASFAHGDRVRVELYIDMGHAERNKELFDNLCEDKGATDQEYGTGLDWERLDDKQASRIATYRSGSIDAGPEELAEIQAWVVENLLIMKSTFGPRVRKQFLSA